MRANRREDRATVTIRPYRLSDYPILRSWWEAHQEHAPGPELLPPESTFIAEIDGMPALSVCVYLTNTKALALVENFIGNPEMRGDMRRQAGAALLEHIRKYARMRGYTTFFCTTDKESLVNRYMEMGFMPKLTGVTALVRSV